MIDFAMLQRLMQQQQRGPGILGQEVAAQGLGGPGFLGQVDAQPAVAGDKGFTISPEMAAAMGQAGQQLMGLSQQPQQQPLAPPGPMPMPQSRQTVGMPPPGVDMAQLWLRNRNAPRLGILGGGM